MQILGSSASLDELAACTAFRQIQLHFFNIHYQRMANHPAVRLCEQNMLTNAYNLDSRDSYGTHSRVHVQDILN